MRSAKAAAASADYTGTMSRRRSLLPVLGALLALAVAPASAEAAAPVNTTAPPPIDWLTSDYDVTLSATDTDGDLDHLEWCVDVVDCDDGAEAQPVAPDTMVTVSGDGVHTLYTRAVDVALEASPWRADTVRIDGAPPSDITDGGTLAWRPTATSVIVVAADLTSGVDQVEWALDGGLLQTGPNGTNVPIAADGQHTLRTRAVDNAGNVSAGRDHPIRVDTLTPVDDTAAPAGWQTAALPVTVTGSDAHSGIALVRWRLDGGAISSSAPPAVVNVAADGQHTLETRVVDGAGHESAWKSHTIRIDTTAPANQTPPADSAWRAADYAVMVSGADGGSGLSHVEWRVNAGPTTTGASPTQATVAGTGTHTLETRAVDVAGNASTWRSEQVRIDLVTPTNTTTAAPSSPVPNPYHATVSGTDAHAGVAHVEWQVDGGPTQSGASGTQVTVSGHGEHTLATRVVDQAGNASSWRTDDIEIDIALNGDTTAPTDTTTTVPTGWRTASLTLTIAATDAGTGVERVEWRVDGQPVQSQAGASTPLTISGEGVHELETRAWDLAGNVSSWRAQTIRIDFTVPADTTAIGPGWKAQRNFTLSADDALSGVQEIQYRINGGAQQTATDGTTIAVGADGTFSIAHRAIDQAGQASPWQTDTLKVDTVVSVNTTAAPAGGWSPTALELELTGTDDRSGVVTQQWRVDGGDVHGGGPAQVETDGEHTLETRVVDAAGNASAWRTDTVRVDVTAPINDTPAAPDGWRATPYTVTVAGSDGAGSGVDRIERTLDGGDVSEDPAVTVTGDGEHTLRTRIVDAVGHASEWRTETIRIDSAKPQVALACGDGWSAQPVACTVGADGGPSGLPTLTVTRDGGAAQTVAAGAAVVVDTDGEHPLTLHATDGAGNRNTTQARVRVDRSAPQAQLACEDHVCSVHASDGVSGLAALAYRVDGGAWTPVAADQAFEVAAGEVRARAVDVAGNETVTNAVEITAAKTGRARSASRPVYLGGRKKTSAMIGALHAARAESGTVTADLRPLALGRGRFRIELRVKAAERDRTVKRTVKIGKNGTSPRLQARLKDATARSTVTLRVLRNAGSKWREHATARLVLPR
jgi:hypothetical protein